MHRDKPTKTVRARAPLRLGLAGGGTDVSPYSDEYGGLVLNATIDRYAYATLSSRSDGLIELLGSDGLPAWCGKVTLNGYLELVTEALRRSWDAKKRMATRITNPGIECIYATAMRAGAAAGKVSGAGGGGFMVFIS
jgi:galactokinase/mevalonate kinase-like predicted kinase